MLHDCLPAFPLTLPWLILCISFKAFVILFLCGADFAYAQHGTVHYEYQDQTEYVFPEAFNDVEGMKELFDQMSTLRNTSMRYVLDFDAVASLMRQDQGYVDSTQSADPMKLVEQMFEEISPDRMAQIGMSLMASGAPVNITAAAPEQTPPQSTYVDFDTGTYLFGALILCPKVPGNRCTGNSCVAVARRRAYAPWASPSEGHHHRRHTDHRGLVYTRNPRTGRTCSVWRTSRAYSGGNRGGSIRGLQRNVRSHSHRLGSSTSCQPPRRGA